MRLASIFLIVVLLVSAIGWYAFRGNTPAPVGRPPAHSVKVPNQPQEMPYAPPQLSTVLLSNFANRNLPLEDRFSGDVLSAIPKVTNPADVAGLVVVLTDPLDQDGVRNEAANILWRSKSPDLLFALLRVLKNPQEKARFRSFAAQHLGSFLGSENLDAQLTAAARLRELMEDKDVEVRREALFALVKSKDPQAETVAVGWLDDTAPESEGVRDLAVRCVAEMNRRESLPRLRELAVQANEETRVAAINTLALWNDEPSRPIFEAALKDKSARIQRAGKAATLRMDSLDRVIPPQAQTVEKLAQALRHERLQIRNEAAIALLRYKNQALPALPTLIEALGRLEPECTTAQIVAYLDVLRNLGESAKSASSVLAELMGERAKIYSNRKKQEVHRLRSYIVLTLSDIGESEAHLQFIVDSLANSDSEMIFNYAAAANATGKMGAKAGAMVPLLLRALGDDFIDSSITLESYHAPITPQNKTSARLESIRALARIGPAAADALPALEKIANSEFKPAKALPDCRAEARGAVAAIRGISKL